MSGRTRDRSRSVASVLVLRSGSRSRAADCKRRLIISLNVPSLEIHRTFFHDNRTDSEAIK